jgi:uncharacterized protein (TIGR02597 family)
LASQTFTTDPLGFVSITTPAGDDTLIGLPLTRPPAVTGVASSVNGAEVTFAASLVADAYNNTHYLLATSGANQGQWSEIVDTTANSITTAEELLAANDSFSVIPFWTLATAFPQGEGIGDTADPFNPARTVKLNDLNAAGTNLSTAATYFYFPGPSPEAGWYQSGSFEPSDNVILSPETYITIRNNAVANITTVVSGNVPSNMMSTSVLGVQGAAQDNQLVNPYPAPLTLSNSGLTDVVAPAADPFNPLDTVKVFDHENSSGQNLSTSATYFYFAGPSPEAGWYQTGSFAPSDGVTIPPGGALIVRKGAGDDEIATWNPPLPYSF